MQEDEGNRPSVTHMVQQQCAATAPSTSDLIRPSSAPHLLQRRVSTSVRLVCIQDVSGSTVAAANGSNRIVPRCSRSAGINPLACLDDLY
jgi:hypothetical protein